MDHALYPVATTEDIVRLRRRIAQASLPPRRTRLALQVPARINPLDHEPH